MGKNTKSGAKKLAPQKKLLLGDLVDKLLLKCSGNWASWNEEWEGFKEIYKIIEEIQILEKYSAFKFPERLKKLDEFWSWCKDNGAQSNGVEIKTAGGNELGIFATEELKEGALFFVIPKRLMLSVETAKESALLPVLEKDPMLQKMPNVLMAIYLLTELTEHESFWKPYLSVLPATFSTILYFSLEELEELKGSSVFAEAVNICRSIARQYGYFYKLLQVNPYLKKLKLKNHFTYDLYRWAVSCVMTRQNAIPSMTALESAVSSLVPLWDLCNHQSLKFSTDFNLEKDQLECYAMKDYAKGDEVFIFYGPRSNRDLFLHSGFVVPDNPHDCYHLKLGISRSDPLYKEKEQLCDKHSLPISGAFKLSLPSSESSQYKLNTDLVNFCQILTANKVDENYEKVPTEVRTFLQTRISLLLKAYKTTLEEDEKLISEEKGTLNENTKLAINVRILEKKLLTAVLKILPDL